MPVAQHPKSLGTAKQLRKRFERAQKMRIPFEPLLREASHFVAPHRDVYYDTNESKGKKRNRDVFDDTATKAAGRYVARKQSTLMPSWREWSMLTPGADFIEHDDADEIGEDLEKLTNDLFRYINHSNFYQVLPDALLDEAISTGALKIEQGDRTNPFRCSAEPLAHLWFEEGPNGTIENVWRQPKVPGRLIERLWPGVELSQKTAQKVAKSPDEDITLIEGTLYEPQLDEYWTVLLEKDEEHIAWAQNHGDTSPWVVFRGDKTPGEVYGRGPGIKALPSIKTANKMVEYTLRHAALAIGGIYTGVTDGVINPYTMKVIPNTVIPVNSNDSRNPSLRALELSGQPDFSHLVLSDIRDGINNIFNKDNRRVEGPVKSATEIAIEDRDLLMDEGHEAGRLQTELVEKSIRRFVAIMQNLGLAPEIKIDGREVTLKHTSPLARAQDTEELIAMTQYFEFVNGMLGQEIALIGTKLEDVPEEVAKRTGFPLKLIRSDEEREEIQQAMASAVAQANEAEAEAAE